MAGKSGSSAAGSTARKTAVSKAAKSSTAGKGTSKTAAKKATAGKGTSKTAAKNAPSKKAITKKTSSKAAPRGGTAKVTARTTRKKAGRSTAKPVDLPVLEQEDPWTADELAEVRTELETDRERLQGEVDEAEADLAELMRDSGEGSGDDQADAGAATWEREHELSLTNNAKELLEQIEHALERIAAGTYGVCESCGNAIGKMRLQAFPRATLCLSCKQKQERR